ncbi:MAG: LysM domain-containing protein [Pseudomonadota bacterium]
MDQSSEFQADALRIYRNIKSLIADESTSPDDRALLEDYKTGFLSNANFGLALNIAAAADQSLDADFFSTLVAEFEEIQELREVGGLNRVPAHDFASQIANDLSMGIRDDIILTEFSLLSDNYINSPTTIDPTPAIQEMDSEALTAFVEEVQELPDATRIAVEASPTYVQVREAAIRTQGASAGSLAEVKATHEAALTELEEIPIETAGQTAYAAQTFLATTIGYEDVTIVTAGFESPSIPENSGITSPLPETFIQAAVTPVQLQQPEINTTPVIVNSKPPLPLSDNFVWNDDAILSTYDSLRTANPETIVGASLVTQEAYAPVQAVLEIEAKLAQYNINPYSYTSTIDSETGVGQLPPTQEALEIAEDTAYTHLAALNSEDAETVMREARAIVDFDTDYDRTPLTPAQQGGQEYLADAGLNSNGTAYLADEAAAAPEETPTPENSEEDTLSADANLLNARLEVEITDRADIATSEHEPKTPSAIELSQTVEANSQPALDSYTVQNGDNLSRIARDELGLTSQAEIRNAVNHIAQLNPELVNPNNGRTYDLANGTNANNIYAGQTLNMPTQEMLATEAADLDWGALINDPRPGSSVTYNESDARPSAEVTNLSDAFERQAAITATRPMASPLSQGSHLDNERIAAAPHTLG